jgi:hypothetical protein
MTALRPQNDAVRLGVYQHYKHTPEDPRYYQVLGIARHTQTEELGVVYVPLYPAGGPRLQFRPCDEFIESIIVGGRVVPRFVYIGHEIPEYSV